MQEKAYLIRGVMRICLLGMATQLAGSALDGETDEAAIRYEASNYGLLQVILEKFSGRGTPPPGVFAKSAQPIEKERVDF